jgi:hypothetical protein
VCRPTRNGRLRRLALAVIAGAGYVFVAVAVVSLLAFAVTLVVAGRYAKDRWHRDRSEIARLMIRR